MSTKESLNQLVKNITGEDVKTERITESLTELVKALDAGGYLKPTDDTISELVDVLAEVLPDKIGGGGITVNESYDISGGTLSSASITLEGDITAHIPDGVVTIGDDAFTGKISLTSIVIPDSVTSIGDRAFSYCSGLTSIVIPDSVTSIGEGAFSFCRGLTSITISNSVTSIGVEAFRECTSLTSITIPDSVTSIDDLAFEDCSGLTSIVIPDSVTRIGSSAFNGCTSLTDIYYTGTQEQWKAIIGILGAEIPEGATIHYEYTPN